MQGRGHITSQKFVLGFCRKLAFVKAIAQARSDPTFNLFVGENAQLDAKTRELIALGVAAQIPCEYCVYGHTKNAMAAGASEAEIREAVATAAHVRHWSTVLNGMAYDFESFKVEVDEMHAPK